VTTVLIIEDAPEAAELATALLRNAGYDTATAADGAGALEQVRSTRPDVILLDLGLPDTDGIDLCRQIREVTNAYLIMLTARADEVDKVLGFKLGADDYVTKPYSPRELLARIEALLRRSRTEPEPDTETRTIGDLVVHPDAHRVTVDGTEVPLTRIEFAILDVLTERPDRVLSRETLRERVWGADWFTGDHVVDVHMANLRKKIDGDGESHIRTVRGVGYRMADGIPE
jgi:DNA-binding response OmpR family regulator